ncbi:MAG: homocysteine S-methyltransferase family protein, partial [Gaiellaceae bacterium]
MAPAARAQTAAYARLVELIASDAPLILDGAVATEIERAHAEVGEPVDSDESRWGTWALYNNPRAVLDVHRAYVDVGCDVISTDTWSILGASELEAATPGGAHWMDVARSGIRLARQAIDESARADECAVAFSLNGDVDSPERLATLSLLARVLEEEPPDLLLLETMSLIREGLTFEAVELAVATGLPVWLSFRRCRHGVCGVYGQHWGGPEGDEFGRAAQRFEQIGVEALLINCLPADHLAGMLPWLRDFTDLPLGVYPNLGYGSSDGWRFDERVGPAEYAELALAWRGEGAQIIGGCCGTSPAHIDAARERLAGTKPGRPKSKPLTELAPDVVHEPRARVEPWRDPSGRSMFPLPFPEIIREPDVFVPTLGSMLVWKYLWENQTGHGKRCLDVGCGSGLLSIQLALNGASAVDATDVERQAVANTLANAFRNGVSDRIHGAEVDLYTFEPRQRYDVVVASLYQMPVDPFSEPPGHRPLD